MTDRFTRRDAEQAFKRLIAAIGGETANHGGRENDGKYLLDYYHGYQIRRVKCDDQGCGETQPFGSRRLTAREFWHAVYFAERVLEVKGGN